MVINNDERSLGLESYGIKNIGNIYRNLSTPALYEEIVKRSEGHIAHLGPIVVRTGHYTGRSPEDKFIVKEESSQDKIWWGKTNKSFEVLKFDYLYHRLLAYLQGKDIFIQDCYAGADPKYRRMGLATIALTEGMKKTKKLGATYCFGGVREFYHCIGFETVCHREKWTKMW